MPFSGNPPSTLLQNPASEARNLTIGGRGKARGKRAGREALGRQREEAMFPVAPPRAGLPSDYGVVLYEIKGRIRQERLRIVMAANSAMVLLYWDIGQMILQRQE